MEFLLKSILTSPAYITSIVICLVIIFISYLFGAKIIGWFGEHWTREALRTLPKDKYLIINNVLIRVNNNTHQIDHIIISSYGVFSIETKQYNGYITGNKYDKKWIRHLGTKKLYYTNPIRQNYGHVLALSELLNIDKNKIFNIVCIPSNAKLKIKHDGELVRYDTIANKILSYKNIIIDNPSLLFKIINENSITDNNQKKQHVKNIKKNIINNNPNQCPWCGNQLIQRNGKYGSFIGCSNYPKCKFTKSN